MRKTKKETCLLKIQTNNDRQDNIEHALQEAIRKASTVRLVVSKTQLEIINLDCVTTIDEVRQALTRTVEQHKDFNIHIFNLNHAGLCDVSSQKTRLLLRKSQTEIR